MENLSEKEILIKIANALEKSAAEKSHPQKKDNLPLIIAMVGFFVTTLGYFFTLYTESEALKAQTISLEKQAEYDLIMTAFQEGKNGAEKQSNLLFLTHLDLIPENKKKVEEGLKNSIVTPKNELIFLDDCESTYETYNLYNLAFELSDTGRYLAAIKVLKKSLEMDSTYFSSYTLLGHSYLQINDYKSAIEAYSDAIELNVPNKTLPLVNRAFCYEALGELEKACADYQNLLIEATENNNQGYIDKANAGIMRTCKMEMH